MRYRFLPEQFCRLTQGISPDALALELGVTRFTIYRWKKGQGQPSGSHLMALADALEIELPGALYAKRKGRRRAKKKASV